MAETTVPTPAAASPFLGWRAERRPPAGFAHVLGAAAGAFAVVAMIAFVSAIDEDDPQAAGVLLSVVLIAAAIAGGLAAPGPVRSACTTVLVLTVPILWLFALLDFDRGPSRGDVRGILLLTLLGYAALYLLAWTKGRAVLLAGTLVVFALWVTFEITGDGGSGDLAVNGPGNTTTPFGSTDSTSTTAAVMIIGIVFLVLAGLLDQRRLSGAATPFLAVGAVGAIFGGVGLGATESEFVAGLIAVLAGGAVGIIGAAGPGRRASVWIGVLAVFWGLALILIDIAPDDSAAGVGAIAAAFAVGLGAIAWLLAPVLHEPDDGESSDAATDSGDNAPPEPEPAGDAS